MAGETHFRLGLVIRSGPFEGRSARDQLDVALAAATLGYDLELFFVGAAAMQLQSRRNPGAALLPRGSGGWRALPQLAGTRNWVEPGAAARLRAGGEPLLEVSELSGPDMRRRLDSCDLVWVV